MIQTQECLDNGCLKVTGQLEGQDFTLYPPVIYERQLGGLAFSSKSVCLEKGRPLDIINNSYMLAFTGYRGAMKTFSLTWFDIWVMAHDRPVFSNYPVEFILVKNSGEHIRKKATVVTVGDMIEHLDDMGGGFISADEYQEICGAYDYNATKAKVMAAHVARVRKYHASFGYTSKFIDWTTTRTRDELDIEIACQDVSRLPWGYGKYEKGIKALWTLRDYSGLWTGYQFNPKNPVEHQYMAYLKPGRGSYDTDFSVSVFESMRGVKYDYEKRVLTDKKETPQISRDVLRADLLNLFDRDKTWYPVQLFRKLGLDPKNKANKELVYDVMDSIGIEQKSQGYYRIEKLKAPA